MMKVNGGDGKRPDFSFVYPRTRLHSSSECFTQLLVGRLFLVLNKMEDTFGWDSSTECPRHLLMLFILLRHREGEKRERERWFGSEDWERECRVWRRWSCELPEQEYGTLI